VEQQSRYEKSLYFWCGEKFTPIHKCPNRNFMLYQLEETDTITVLDSKHAKGTPIDIDGLQQLEQQVIEHHLSYNVMSRTGSPTIIRVKAQINGLEIQALIDGGSSDSFIQPRITKFLNFPVKLAPNFMVMVGNFEVMIAEGFIPYLEITMPKYKVHIPEVYVVHVAGNDLIIGTTWLKQLKAHIVDYDSSFIRCLHEGKFVTVF